MRKVFISLLFLSWFSLRLVSQETISGTWTMIPDNSSHIDLFGQLSLRIQINKQGILINRDWGTGSRRFDDSILLERGKPIKSELITSRIFPTNAFMGIKLPVGEKRVYQYELKNDQQYLSIRESFPVLISQGNKNLTVIHEFEYDPETELLQYKILRNTRPDDNPLIFLFKRDGFRNAWFMNLESDWHIDKGLPVQSALISLQGIVNKEKPNLYFVYPEDWDFRFTPEVFAFLKDKHYYSFKKLNNLDQALETFGSLVNGYIIWDKKVRTSLIVSFTLAGLKNAIVIDESLLPLMKKHNIPQVEDFRAKFEGWSDIQIYSWAKEQYWSLCSRDKIVWMGGESGNIMRPGVADWGIYNQSFFNDLSTKPADSAEYQLADELLGEMNDMAMVFGWHSYAKDKERDHVTLTSKHGLRVEGLHTLPNMSFLSQIQATTGFEFKNNHSEDPSKEYIPEKKVYIACVQTDCLGLGAWTRPGRGSMPYAWEVTMNWVWLAPAMMEFFYSQATPNDYFIGSLSGPGYMYPKAIPDDKIDELLTEANKLMKILDLNVFEIMDYSEGATIEGNTELTKKVINAYLRNMPDVIGFINGYTQSYTFGKVAGKPIISYDYYLSPERPEKEATADISELSTWNDKRPYFLLMHVRQWSNITRVKRILDDLGPDFEVVPLDLFIRMAQKNQTYTERFLER